MFFDNQSWPRPWPYPDRWLSAVERWFDARNPASPDSIKLHGEFARPGLYPLRPGRVASCRCRRKCPASTAPTTIARRARKARLADAACFDMRRPAPSPEGAPTNKPRASPWFEDMNNQHLGPVGAKQAFREPVQAISTHSPRKLSKGIKPSFANHCATLDDRCTSASSSSASGIHSTGELGILFLFSSDPCQHLIERAPRLGGARRTSSALSGGGIE